MTDQVTLINTTDSVLCIADHSNYYATLDPGKTIKVNSEWISKDAFSAPLRHGWLSEVKGGVKFPPKVPQTPPRVQRDVVSFKSEDETEMDPNVVSSIQPGQSEGIEVNKDHGAKIVRRGRGRPPKMAKVESTVPKNVQSEVDEVDESEGRGFTITPGMPGQGRMVPVQKDIMSSLEAMATRQEEIWRELERERKILSYGQMDEKRRIMQIDEETDIEFLKSLIAMEKSAKLSIRIKNRIKNLALGD